jgi:cytochrome c biogenesis protein
MTTTETRPTKPAPERRSGELTPLELTRWAWRQLTSMRTALILLLLLALAAIPGSLIPQERTDSLKTGEWKDQHTTLAPLYDKLGLFNVYGSPWFAAIYILLTLSLVGCILPRAWKYARGLRAQPPAAPRNLTRLPAHASYTTAQPVEEVLAQARTVLGKRGVRGYRLRRDAAAGTVAAEKGYLRELGNLVFHLSILLVLAGFAIGSLFGYKGGRILVTGSPFSNSISSYDDFAPGSLFDPGQMDKFTFTVNKFDISWLYTGPRAGMATKFGAHLTYSEDGGPDEDYDLRVNHPLTIGSTSLFLIGHGYAPDLTIKDGNGNIVSQGPWVFLPTGPDFSSFGVVKLPDSPTGAIGLNGEFFPWFSMVNGDPVNLMGDDKDPLISMNVYTGDLGLDDGSAQSVYTFDTKKATAIKDAKGQLARIDLRPGDEVTLPDGLGSVTFNKVDTWQRIQISQTPGKYLALVGVVLALAGLMGSLFIRSRRVWVRATETEQGTLVEVAGLDRSGGADTDAVLSRLVERLQPAVPATPEEPT